MIGCPAYLHSFCPCSHCASPKALVLHLNLQHLGQHQPGFSTLAATAGVQGAEKWCWLLFCWTGNSPFCLFPWGGGLWVVGHDADWMYHDPLLKDPAVLSKSSLLLLISHTVALKGEKCEWGRCQWSTVLRRSLTRCKVKTPVGVQEI